jgi:hypothetical protein
MLSLAADYHSAQQILAAEIDIGMATIAITPGRIIKMMPGEIQIADSRPDRQQPRKQIATWRRNLPKPLL